MPVTSAVRELIIALQGDRVRLAPPREKRDKPGRVKRRHDSGALYPAAARGVKRSSGLPPLSPEAGTRGESGRPGQRTGVSPGVNAAVDRPVPRGAALAGERPRGLHRAPPQAPAPVVVLGRAPHGVAP